MGSSPDWESFSEVKIKKASIWTSLIIRIETIFLMFYYKGKTNDLDLGPIFVYVCPEECYCIRGYNVLSCMDHKASKHLLQGSLHCVVEPLMELPWIVRAFLWLLGCTVPEELEFYLFFGCQSSFSQLVITFYHVSRGWQFLFFFFLGRKARLVHNWRREAMRFDKRLGSC